VQAIYINIYLHLALKKSTGVQMLKTKSVSS
jgi:hypothetical protein